MPVKSKDCKFLLRIIELKNKNVGRNTTYLCAIKTQGTKHNMLHMYAMGEGNK